MSSLANVKYTRYANSKKRMPYALLVYYPANSAAMHTTILADTQGGCCKLDKREVITARRGTGACRYASSRDDQYWILSHTLVDKITFVLFLPNTLPIGAPV